MFFSFFFLEMDPIFQNNGELKRGYKKLLNEILPSLNTCGNCNCLNANIVWNFLWTVTSASLADAEYMLNLIKQKTLQIMHMFQFILQIF